jgi:hypothetical protein
MPKCSEAISAICAALHQFVLHQITDQRQAIALGLLPSLLGAFFRKQFGLHQLLGQTAQCDVIHGDSAYCSQ